jgi:alpha-tubulin suppressor-like RCC1 family protein
MKNNWLLRGAGVWTVIILGMLLFGSKANAAGKLFGWGDNYFNQLSFPAGLTNVVAAGGGYWNTVTLGGDGTAVNWAGSNVIAGVSNLVAIAVGPQHVVALKADGTVVAWGNNLNQSSQVSGQIDVPPGLSNVVAVAAGGFHSLALRSDGTVVGWGDNSFGQLTMLPSLTDAVAIAAGIYHNFILKADGTVVGWGGNAFGQFDIPANLTNVVALASGYHHGVARKRDGSVVCWGGNFDSTISSVPPNLTNTVAIFAGGYHTLALQSNNQIVAWGQNGSGQTNVPPNLTNVIQLGAGGGTSLAILGDDGRPAFVLQPAFRQIHAGEDVTLDSLAVGSPSISYRWQFNGVDLPGSTNSSLTLHNAQFLDGGAYRVVASNAFGSAVSSVATLTVWTPPSLTLQPQSQIVISGTNVSFTAAATGSQPLSYNWLLNGNYLADGGRVSGVTTTNLNLANIQSADAGNYTLFVLNPWGAAISSIGALTVLVPATITKQPVSQSTPAGLPAIFTVSASGTAPLSYQWLFNGANLAGATGSALALASVQPTDLGSYSVVVTNNLGSATSSVATLTLGPVFAWGRGTEDQSSVSPSLADVVAIAAGGNQSISLKNDGTVSAWGSFWNGQSNAPVTVPPDLTNLVAIAAGSNHFLSLRGDGTVIAWGNNDYGQANPPASLSNVVALAGGGSHSLALQGNGTVVAWGQANVPVGLTNVVAIAAQGSHSLALKEDGTIVGWGDLAVPNGLTNIVAIAAGGGHGLGLKADGTLTAWGANTYGQISIPAGLTNVAAITAGANHSLALNADGSVVAWGNNDYGQGVLPASLTNVATIAAGAQHNLTLVGDGSPMITLPPVNRTTYSGTSVTLNAKAAGLQPLSFQWQHEGINLTDATNRWLTVANAQVPDAGSYRVIVSNAMGATTSHVAVLTVLTVPPFFVVGTQGQTVTEGAEAVFRVSMSGSQPVTYQWLFAGNVIPGATNDVLLLTNVQYAAAGIYSIVASNAYGFTTNYGSTLYVTPPPGFLWARNGGGSGADQGKAVALDATGNLYVVGSFSTNASFGSTTLTSAGNTDAFVAKYNQAGNLLWAAQAGGPTADSANAVAISPAGEVYVTGSFTGTANFGTTNLVAAGFGDIFIAKYDSAGNLLWVQRAGGPGSNQANGVAVDTAGNAYVAGFFSNIATFGSTNLLNSGGRDIFLTKYNPAGQVVWARRAGGTSEDESRGVAVDPSGNIYLAGYFQGTGAFGSSNLTATGLQDIFVAKYDPAGTLLWAQKAGGPNADFANGIAVDSLGNAYVTGYFQSGTNVLSASVAITNNSASSTSAQIFLAKYDPNGIALWARAAGGFVSDFGNAVAVDGPGNVYVAGSFQSTATFGNTNLTTSGSDDLFVTMYAPSGNLLWIRKGGGFGSDVGLGIAPDQTGNVFVTGYFNGRAAFDQTSFLTAGAADVFVSKLVAFEPVASPIFDVQPTNQSIIAGTSITLSGGVVSIQPLTYQWQRDGIDIAGATNANLTTAAITNALYSLIASNAYGTVTSAVAVVSVEVSPDFVWSFNTGGTGTNGGYAVAVDPSTGDTYLAGSFSGTADFGPTNLVSGGAEDVFIARFDSSHNLVWALQCGGAGPDRATGLALDPNGEILVAGYFTGPATFGPMTVPTGGTNMFVVKFRRDGSFRWLRQADTSTTPTLAADSAGSVLVTGSFKTSVSFDGVTLVGTAGVTNAFVAKYDTLGNILWARGVTGGGPIQGRGVTVDGARDVFITGSFRGLATFTSTNFAMINGLDVFVAKYDPNGNVLWARRAGNTPGDGSILRNDEALAIASDRQGNVAVAGYFNGPTFFGSNVLTSVASNQPGFFLAKYDPAGNVLWATQNRGKLAATGNSLATDAAGNLFVTGVFRETASFDSQILTSVSGSDIFIALYDATGRLVKVRRAGGSADDAGQAVASDGHGNVFVAGSFSGSGAFGGDLLISHGVTDAFLAELAFIDPNTAPVITSGPRSQTAVLGSSALLQAGVIGSSPLAFQWWHNGNAVAGATNASLYLSAVQFPDLGQYSVIVSNGFGAVTSAVATLVLDATPEFVWLHQAGTNLPDAGFSTALDSAGNLYVAGSFSGANASFSGTLLTSSGGTDAFLAKYDRSGNLLWANRAGGTASDAALSVAVDSADNVCFTGYSASSSFSFGSVTLTNLGAGAIFLAKCDPAGNVLWARRSGYSAGSPEQGDALAIDASNNVYLSGFYKGNATFGNISVANANLTNFFLAKYDPSGNPLWVKSAAGTSHSRGNGVAVDADGGLYVIGNFAGNLSYLSLGGIVLTNLSGTGSFGETVFVAKYNAAGTLQWARTPDSSIGFGQAIVVDALGSLYSATYQRGYTVGTLLTKYDALGNTVWTASANISCCTGSYVGGNALALDTAGNIFMTGGGNATATLGGFSVSGGYVAKYKPDGSFLWVKKLGSVGYGVAIDRANNDAYLTGLFTAVGFFGSTNFLYTGLDTPSDAFIVKLGLRPPSILSITTNQAVIVGSNAVLNVVASGTGPFGYQWQFNGANISGATQSTFTVANFVPAKAGQYSVIIQNGVGSTTNATTVLTAIPVLQSAQTGAGFVLSWLGAYTLQTATNLAGPFVDMPGATSPFTNTASADESQRFFRLR